jgi:hypothetical protein
LAISPADSLGPRPSQMAEAARRRVLRWAGVGAGGAADRVGSAPPPRAGDGNQLLDGVAGGHVRRSGIRSVLRAEPVRRSRGRSLARPSAMAWQRALPSHRGGRPKRSSAVAPGDRGHVERASRQRLMRAGSRFTGAADFPLDWLPGRELEAAPAGRCEREEMVLRTLDGTPARA